MFLPFDKNKTQENENQANNKTIGINLFHGAHFKAEKYLGCDMATVYCICPSLQSKGPKIWEEKWED